MNHRLNYGAVGNCRTAALISETGNIEWLCLPEFDSPSIFAALLDREKGGCFGFEVSEAYRTEQSYIPHTNILSTHFISDEAEFTVLDFMPYYRAQNSEHYLPAELYRYVRRIRGVPRFRVHYARGKTIRNVGTEYIESYSSLNATDRQYLYSSIPLEDIERSREIVLEKDEFFLLSYNEKVTPVDIEREKLEYCRTLVYWLNWSNRTKKYTLYNDVIERSLLTLKLMSYYNGAMLAALTTSLPETGAEYKIRFMLRKNVCEIMLDTTGEGLHKRGYRRNAMEAPIRETLAATIADLGRVRRDSLVEDPFCGSGTLLIEAAQKAMNIAPGLKRRFAAERYSFVPASLWAEQRQKALAESKLDVGFEAFGYDIDPAAVALANANAKLAGVEKRCHFEVADVADFAAKPEAIVLTNPPYGERMNTIEGAAKLARTLGQQMAEHPCAGLYAITADMEFESHYGKRANKRRKMYNGMIPCQLYMYYEAPKFEHKAKPMPKQGFDGKRTAEFKKK